ncbi:MAG: hypothetical protein AAFX07_00555 [Pseudomonadota bacterium]
MTTPIAASNIAAQAFRAIELSAPSSFQDDSPQAGDASEQYPVALRIVLELCDWSFASTLVSLAPASPPATGYVEDQNLPGLFRLPTECVRLREVQPTDVKFRIDADRYIRADETTSLTVRYTKLITNEALLPSTFQTAVAYRLAMMMAPRWLRDRTKRQALKSDFNDMLDEAQRSDRRTASSQPYDHAAEATGTSVDWVSEALR